jgi:hypothetical protein
MWDLTIPGNDDHDFYIDTAAGSLLVHDSGSSCGRFSPGNKAKIWEQNGSTHNGVNTCEECGSNLCRR